MSHAADPLEPGVNAKVERSSEAEVLDGSVFQDLLDSLVQPVAVAALYRKFVENAAAFIGQLHNQEDAERIDTLHTLKGSAAMMGARRMASLAMHWQAQLQGSPVHVARAIPELEGELASFRVAIAARLLEAGASPGIPE